MKKSEFIKRKIKSNSQEVWIIRNLLQKPPRFEFGVLLWGAYVQVGWSAHQDAYGLQSFTFI